jgi:hypothetical protein
MWMDFLGSEYTRLGEQVPANDTTGLLGILQNDVSGFDLLRRKSFRGEVFASAVASEIARPPAPRRGRTTWRSRSSSPRGRGTCRSSSAAPRGCRWTSG